jgi:hypothetical protein
MSTKCCSRCRQEKPFEAFNKDKATKDGLSYYCRVCKSRYPHKPAIKYKPDYDGVKICSRCGLEKPKTEFYAHSNYKDGLHRFCKPCVIVYNGLSRLRCTDPAVISRRRAAGQVRQKERHKRLRDLVDAFRANGCAICDEKTLCCLVAHHLNPTEKESSVSRMVWNHRPVEEVIAELAKCICICENCHRKLHARLVALPSS